MTDKSTNSYNDIKIPDQKLIDSIEKGIRRARKEKFEKIVKNTAGIAASIALAGFVAANVPSIYSEAVKLPVVGNFVKAMHVGEGGDDAVKGSMISISDKDTVVIKYKENENEDKSVKPYTINYHNSPIRIELSFKDMDKKEYESLKKNLIQTGAVLDVYRVEEKQKDFTRFNVILKDLKNYEVMEFENPGKLTISFFDDAYYTKDENHPQDFLYTVLTDKYDDIKNIKDFENLNKIDESSILKTEDGKYIMTFGEFRTEKDAKNQVERIYGKNKNEKLHIKKMKVGEGF